MVQAKLASALCTPFSPDTCQCRHRTQSQNEASFIRHSRRGCGGGRSRRSESTAKGCGEGDGSGGGGAGGGGGCGDVDAGAGGSVGAGAAAGGNCAGGRGQRSTHHHDDHSDDHVHDVKVTVIAMMKMLLAMTTVFITAIILNTVDGQNPALPIIRNIP